MDLEAGELNSRVLLQKRSTKQNEIGEVEDTWIDIGHYRGKLSVLNNKTKEIAKGFSASVDHEIKMRYRPNATNDCRILFGAEVYQIGGVIHDPNPIKTWTQLFLSKQQG